MPARTAVAAAVAAALRPLGAVAALAGVRELLAVAGRDHLGGDLDVALHLAEQLQRDTATLAVDLGDRDVHEVAAIEHLLDGVDAQARRNPRDVQQAVGALADLDEGAEV